MWKLSQEETFADKIRAKEAQYLQELGEEWKRRENERQKLLTEKVDHALLCNHSEICPKPFRLKITAG